MQLYSLLVQARVPHALAMDVNLGWTSTLEQGEAVQEASSTDSISRKSHGERERVSRRHAPNALNS